MFRLCATIGSSSRIAEIMAPNAITLIEIGEDTGGMSLSDVRLMLAATILPEGADLLAPDRIGDPKRNPDLCVVEIDANARRKIRNTQEATEALVQGLESPSPVLILAEGHSAVPDDIRRALPESLYLAPLSRDILMSLIATTNSATGKIDRRIYDALPPDCDLARLAALERLVGRQALEIEFLKTARARARSRRSAPTSVITGPTVSRSDGGVS